MATFWITKYALTAPIFTIESEVGPYVRDTRENSYSWSSFKAGKEAFTSYEDAKADAEARRDKRIASLKKQINKLEK